MKKSLVILLVVAVLGAATISARDHDDRLKISNPNTTTQSRIISSFNTTQNPSSPNLEHYKDGSYDGNNETTPYGDVQIAVVISGGKITDVNFLNMPNDRGHSREITNAVEPIFKNLTLEKQSANIDFISGATSTSYGYEQSLQSALDKAAGASAINISLPSDTFKV